MIKSEQTIFSHELYTVIHILNVKQNKEMKHKRRKILKTNLTFFSLCKMSIETEFFLSQL